MMSLATQVSTTGFLACGVAVVMVRVIRGVPTKPQLILLGLLAYGGFTAAIVGALVAIWS